MFKKISTDKAPRALGPYSQAVIAGNLVFVSGQISLDPATGVPVKGDIQTQTRRVIENISGILKESGCSADNVVKTTVYLKNMKDFKKMNEVYASFFKSKPSRTTVEVSRLPGNVLVAIDAVAVIS